jgi:hypothetical protein
VCRLMQQANGDCALAITVPSQGSGLELGCR